MYALQNTDRKQFGSRQDGQNSKAMPNKANHGESPQLLFPVKGHGQTFDNQIQFFSRIHFSTKFNFSTELSF